MKIKFSSTTRYDSNSTPLPHALGSNYNWTYKFVPILAICLTLTLIDETGLHRVRQMFARAHVTYFGHKIIASNADN